MTPRARSSPHHNDNQRRVLGKHIQVIETTRRPAEERNTQPSTPSWPHHHHQNATPPAHAKTKAMPLGSPKMKPPAMLCCRGHNTVIRSGKPGPRFSPGDHQRTVGAGAPQRHLVRGNGVKGHRCHRQRQSRCRILTRSLSTSLQKRQSITISNRRSQPHLAETTHDATSAQALDPPG